VQVESESVTSGGTPPRSPHKSPHTSPLKSPHKSPHNYDKVFSSPKKVKRKTLLAPAVCHAVAETPNDEGVTPFNDGITPYNEGVKAFFRSDRVNSLKKFDVEVSGEEIELHESEMSSPVDVIPYVPAPKLSAVANNPLLFTSSFVASMSEYAFRRETVVRAVAAGDVVGELTKDTDKEDKAAMVNVEVYTDVNQARRRHVSDVLMQVHDTCAVLTPLCDTTGVTQLV